MDLTSLIEIVVVIVVAYFFIRFIVSPFIKIILGVLAFLILIYLLQRFLGFNFDKVLADLGVSSFLNKWGLNINWILNPINYFMNYIKNFIDPILQNIIKK